MPTSVVDSKYDWYAVRLARTTRAMALTK